LVTSYENEFGVRDLYVFTLKGEFIAQTEAPLVSQNVDAPYPFTISAGKIFQIVEDEDGESWALFIHNLELSSS
jgi:hypothetical protein